MSENSVKKDDINGSVDPESIKDSRFTDNTGKSESKKCEDNSNKILVALDGSEKSLKTIQYLCDFKPFMGKDILLFNVLSPMPDAYWDMNIDFLNDEPALPDTAQWETEQRHYITDFMEEAKVQLISGGYTKDRVSFRIQERIRGVARDIIDEASKGYFALLSRRRGAGAMLNMVMGSTTTKIVEKLSSVPILLAGVQRANNSIFLALDGSPGSKKAVDFTIRAVAGSDCRIVLCSVLRDLGLRQGKNENMGDGPGWINKVFDKVTLAIDDAAQRFQAAGIPVDRIKKKIITGASTRSDVISATAEEEKCDTIVLGRRGQSNVTDFNIGRVPWKVIYVARKMTVWIVS
ncbi:putative UspA domain-containing protein [Desulfamplus magnetovallimortis]|uniref:Putative UspA domain-containing protein n=1 Tax=Desulfamplus magnetovallimortis TaxID=1246637 RepID=A0A1W1H6D4_9BACT|nr:universal stress protein [Desulfamplus magnetovallimortis]SLM28017.1 putative UspA domain-containing protein [Desulfamplus magnetovallimortis]